MGRLGEIYPTDFMRAMNAGADISQYAGVYVSAANTVKMPTTDVPEQCYGVAIESASSGDKNVQIVTLGKAEALAGEAISVGGLVTLRGTSGYFFNALQGEPVAGIALTAATAASDHFTLELGRYSSARHDYYCYYTDATSRTDDYSVSLNCPAGTYIVDYIFITANGVVTGGLKFGTAAGGAQIATGIATANGNTLVDGTDTGCVAGFALAADQTLYVADVTAWNSVTISRLAIGLKRIY